MYLAWWLNHVYPTHKLWYLFEESISHFWQLQNKFMKFPFKGSWKLWKPGNKRDLKRTTKATALSYSPSVVFTQFTLPGREVGMKLNQLKKHVNHANLRSTIHRIQWFCESPWWALPSMYWCSGENSLEMWRIDGTAKNEDKIFTLIRPEGSDKMIFISLFPRILHTCSFVISNCLLFLTI